MIRLNLIVEGQTELGVVDTLLKPHLAKFHVYTSARCVETGRNRQKNKIYRGGMVSYEKLKNDLSRWIKQDQHADARFSTERSLSYPRWFSRILPKT
jgi:hypothetical protein